MKADKNSLIVFPSDLEHEVDTKPSKNTRISLSFNSFLKGNLGQVASLDYLCL
jgi:hypothetical protein